MHQQPAPPSGRQPTDIHVPVQKVQKSKSPITYYFLDCSPIYSTPRRCCLAALGTTGWSGTGICSVRGHSQSRWRAQSEPTRCGWMCPLTQTTRRAAASMRTRSLQGWVMVLTSRTFLSCGVSPIGLSGTAPSNLKNRPMR